MGALCDRLYVTGLVVLTGLHVRLASGGSHCNRLSWALARSGQTKTVFFAAFTMGIPGIPRKAVFSATFRAANDLEFHVETGNPESSPRPVRTHLGKMAAHMDSPENG